MLKRNKLKVQTKKKGQSTVEYIILVAGVLAALIVFLRPGGPFNNALDSTLNSQLSEMNTMSSRLADSHNPDVR
ncbi:MAG: class III signal peptide-containing protein [Candidatus Zapsychrus exili]|nr:class III signal peptide-containing protein [Candidatus Zapsychrus exili]